MMTAAIEYLQKWASSRDAQVEVRQYTLRLLLIVPLLTHFPRSHDTCSLLSTLILVPIAVAFAICYLLCCICLQIIVVDDGSTDSTAALVERYVQQLHEHAHLTARLVHLRQNRGKGAALKLGVLQSHGDYVLIVRDQVARQMYNYSFAQLILYNFTIADFAG